MKKNCIFSVVLTSLAAATTIVPLVSCSQNQESKERTLTFSSSEGGTIQGELSFQVNNGQKWKDINKPTYTANLGYAFSGWYNADKLMQDDDTINSDMSIVAKFIREANITITFSNSEGGTLEGQTTVSVAKGTTWSAISKPTARPNDGYKFQGWYNGDYILNDSDVIENNITAFAKFKSKPGPEVISVTFGSTDGGSISGDKIVSINSGTKWKDIQKPTPEAQADFAFDGWYCNDRKMSDEDIIDHPIGVIAKFIKRTCVVSFSASTGGSISGTLTTSIIKGSKWADVKSKAPTAKADEGYKFSNWYCNGEEITDQYVISSDIAIIAQFVESGKVLVSFAPSIGGKLEGKTIVSVLSGTKWKDITKPTTKADDRYHFEKWMHGDMEISDEEIITTNFFALAQFKTTAYEYVRLTFNSQDQDVTFKGQLNFDIIKDQTKWSEVTKPQAFKPGCSFDKWTKNDGSELKDDTVFSEDVTIIPTFTDMTVNLTFQAPTAPEGVEFIGQTTISVEKGVTKWKDINKPTPIKANWKLANWTSNGKAISDDDIFNEDTTIVPNLIPDPYFIKIKSFDGTTKSIEKPIDFLSAHDSFTFSTFSFDGVIRQEDIDNNLITAKFEQTQNNNGVKEEEDLISAKLINLDSNKFSVQLTLNKNILDTKFSGNIVFYYQNIQIAKFNDFSIKANFDRINVNKFVIESRTSGGRTYKQINRFVDNTDKYNYKRLIFPNVDAQGNKLESIYSGSSNFTGLNNLTAVYIDKDIFDIDQNSKSGCAFSNCPLLEDIKVDPENTALSSRDENGNECNCIIQKSKEGWREIVGTKTMNFSNCLLLGCSKTTIPANTLHIWNNAFSGCVSLEKISIPASVISFGPAYMDNGKVLPWRNWYADQSKAVPVWETMASVFSNCINLKEVIFADNSNLQWIGRNSFENCTSLKWILFPDSLTNIRAKAFSGCTSLLSLHIPKNVSAISGDSFYEGKNVETYSGISNGAVKMITITVDPENPVYTNVGTIDGQQKHCDCIIEKQTKSLVQGCSNSVIPDDVKIISPYSFDGQGIQSVDLFGSNVTTISPNAFEHCEQLETLKFGNKITKIGSEAFSYCSKLKQIHFESGFALGSETDMYSTAFTNSIPNTGSLYATGATPTEGEIKGRWRLLTNWQWNPKQICDETVDERRW